MSSERDELLTIVSEAQADAILAAGFTKYEAIPHVLRVYDPPSTVFTFTLPVRTVPAELAALEAQPKKKRGRPRMDTCKRGHDMTVDGARGPRDKQCVKCKKVHRTDEIARNKR